MLEIVYINFLTRMHYGIGWRVGLANLVCYTIGTSIELCKGVWYTYCTYIELCILGGLCEHRWLLDEVELMAV